MFCAFTLALSAVCVQCPLRLFLFIIIIITVIIIIIIIITIIIIIVSFMQGSHTHIPGTNHVPRGYTVAPIVFVVHGASMSSSCVGSFVLLR